MSRRSLRARLLTVGAISVTLTLAAALIGLMLLFKRHVEHRVEVELNAYLAQLIAGLDRNDSGEIVVERPPSDPRFERPLSGLYWQLLIEPSGIQMRSRSLWDSELALPALPDRSVRRHRLPGPSGANLYVVERRFAPPERLRVVSIRAAAAVDTAEIRDALNDFIEDLSPFLLLIGFLLMMATGTQAFVGLRPLAAVRQRLAAVRSEGSQRIGEGFPEEVQPLATEIDALLDARDRQIATARARASDLAHALKTPLQVLAGEAERLRAKGENDSAACISEITTAMRRQVERSLSRARIGTATSSARADVGKIAGQVANVVGRTPNGLKLNWQIDVAPQITAPIDADDLAEVLGNLLENAAKHAHSRVMISARSELDCVSLEIIDDGVGIPPEQVTEAKTRGGRLDELKQGTGLGLAIVTEIVETWGGGFSIENNQPGMKAILRFPNSPTNSAAV